MISLDDAIAGHTVHAAWQQMRDKDIGSIQVGKFADFTQINVDPYMVDPSSLHDAVTTLGTWVGGRKADLDAFMAEATTGIRSTTRSCTRTCPCTSAERCQRKG